MWPRNKCSSTFINLDVNHSLHGWCIHRRKIQKCQLPQLPYFLNYHDAMSTINFIFHCPFLVVTIWGWCLFLWKLRQSMDISKLVKCTHILSHGMLYLLSTSNCMCNYDSRAGAIKGQHLLGNMVIFTFKRLNTTSWQQALANNYKYVGTKWSHNIIISLINVDKFSLLWWQMVSMASEVLGFVSIMAWTVQYTLHAQLFIHNSLLHWPRATGQVEMQEWNCIGSRKQKQEQRTEQQKWKPKTEEIIIGLSKHTMQ